MAATRPPAPAAPFFTPRTVLVCAGLSLVAVPATEWLGKVQGPRGALAAIALSLGTVSFFLCWVGGAVMAVRLRSFLLLLAVVLLPLLGPVLCAIVAGGQSGPPPPSRGSKR